jgi:hypothetical protein
MKKFNVMLTPLICSLEKRNITFEAWRKDFESRTRAKGIKPRLYRATLNIEDWATPINPTSPGHPPLVMHPRVWLAYDKGFDRCLDHDEDVAVGNGGLYYHFMLDESSTHVDLAAFNDLDGSLVDTDLIVYRGKTYFTHVYGDATDPEQKATLYISKPSPTLGPESSKYLFDYTCRINFTYGNNH